MYWLRLAFVCWVKDCWVLIDQKVKTCGEMSEFETGVGQSDGEKITTITIKEGQLRNLWDNFITMFMLKNQCQFLHLDAPLFFNTIMRRSSIDFVLAGDLSLWHPCTFCFKLLSYPTNSYNNYDPFLPGFWGNEGEVKKSVESVLSVVWRRICKLNDRGNNVRWDLIKQGQRVISHPN